MNEGRGGGRGRLRKRPGVSGNGREKKEEGKRGRRRRFSIDGRLNNSKASCPAIFKRRAPTCACGRNPWSNSGSPNKCILLMEREGETLLRLSNRISSSRLSRATPRNREFLGPDRDIHGDRLRPLASDRKNRR